MSVEYFSPFSFAPVLIGGKVNGHKTPALFFMCSSHFDCPTSTCSEFLNPKGIHENQDGVPKKWLRFSLGIIVALEIVITQPLCMPGRSICKASAYLIIWYHNPLLEQCLMCRTHDLIWRLSLIKIILSLGFLYCCVLTQVSYQQDEKSQIGWNLWGSIESDLKAIWSTHDSPSLSKDKTLKLSSRRPHWWGRGEIC